MRPRAALLCALILPAALLAATLGTPAQQGSASSPADSVAAAPPAPAASASNSSNSSTSEPAAHSRAPRTEAAVRLEGERRFRANCGRCHQSPQKYSPRVMATIIRHMRVRATLTDQDMRYIMAYMTK
jgi:hypothetical protein